MDAQSRRWATVGVSALALVVVSVLSSLSGCNPHKNQLRPENILAQISGRRGQLIEPRKCMLRVAILDRSFHDPSINEVAWRAADEQSITPEARRLAGERAACRPDHRRVAARVRGRPCVPPPHKVEPASFLLDDGEHTLISISDMADQVTMLLNRENHPYGRDYQAASGYFRVIATHDGTSSVALRFTPEIHHGPVQRRSSPRPAPPPTLRARLRINDGQQEESLPDLSATVTLEPGQVAVIGCRPEQERSLGAFLFTQANSHGDQRRQKLILVWADRNQLGLPGESVAHGDRPAPGLALKIGAPAAAGSAQGADEPAQSLAGKSPRSHNWTLNAARTLSKYARPGSGTCVRVTDGFSTEHLPGRSRPVNDGSAMRPMRRFPGRFGYHGCLVAGKNNAEYPDPWRT